MSINADTLRRLSALHLAPEAMSEVLLILADVQSAEDTRKAKDRNRKRPVHQHSVEIPGNSNGKSVDHSAETPPPNKMSPTPPKELTPTPAHRQISARAREAFAEFKKIYPKRTGSQPWAPAEAKFLAICRGGVLPDEILAGAIAYAAAMADDDPQFVAQAITWLNQKRWMDDHQPKQLQMPRGPPQGAKSAIQNSHLASYLNDHGLSLNGNNYVTSRTEIFDSGSTSGNGASPIGFARDECQEFRPVAGHQAKRG